MDNVISLAQAKEERQPHWSGIAHCVGCKSEWVAVAPIGTLVVECPECGLHKGVPKFPFGADEGDAALVCSPCGGEALFAYVNQGRKYIRCMGCGNDLTEAFYEG